MNLLTKKKVVIRRNLGKAIRPEAEQLDGKEYLFYYGWKMGKAEPYPGEIAWIPRDDTYPKNAPIWIASGDLKEVIENE